MTSRFFVTIFAVMVSLTSAVGSASAGYITSNGTLQFAGTNASLPLNPGANPPIEHIQQLTHGAGRLWTNQVGGAPFQVGNAVRTVGAISIEGALNGSLSPVTFPNGTRAHFIFAVEGQIFSPGVADFTRGSLFLSVSRPLPDGGFQPNDPLTWTPDNFIAKYDLLPKASIGNGNLFGNSPAAPLNFSAGSVNRSGVSGIFQGVIGDGVFAFGEDTNFQLSQNNSNNGGVGSFFGDQFLRDVENAIMFEGFAPVTQQTGLTTGFTLLDTQVGVLDDIGVLAGFSGAFSEGGFNPVAINSMAPTGDFAAILNANTYVITAVPEPSSVLAFAVLIGGAGLRLARRRRIV